MLNALRDDELSRASGRVLSEAQLDLVSGGMNVQINQISSRVSTTTAGPGLLQKVASLVVDALKTAESLAQRGHPN